jgi:hypothetical protein
LATILGKKPNCSITLINSVSEALSITTWPALTAIIGQKPKPLHYIEKFYAMKHNYLTFFANYSCPKAKTFALH